jgi:hypothetical protein
VFYKSAHDFNFARYESIDFKDFSFDKNHRDKAKESGGFENY